MLREQASQIPRFIFTTRKVGNAITALIGEAADAALRALLVEFSTIRLARITPAEHPVSTVTVALTGLLTRPRGFLRLSFAG